MYMYSCPCENNMFSHFFLSGMSSAQRRRVLRSIVCMSICCYIYMYIDLCACVYLQVCLWCSRSGDRATLYIAALHIFVNVYLSIRYPLFFRYVFGAAEAGVAQHLVSDSMMGYVGQVTKYIYIYINIYFGIRFEYIRYRRYICIDAHIYVYVYWYTYIWSRASPGLWRHDGVSRAGEHIYIALSDMNI